MNKRSQNQVGKTTPKRFSAPYPHTQPKTTTERLKIGENKTKKIFRSLQLIERTRKTKRRTLSKK